MNQIKSIGEYLKDHEIKPSYQRIKIFEYLNKERSHPTVDTIYKALCPQIPTLSKTTVYNTLNLFVEKEIINVVIIEENETRYDAEMTTHGHFKCEKCGNIYDIEIDTSKFDKSLLEDYEVREQHYYFKGICQKCLKK